MASYLDVCRFNPTAGGTTDWTFSSAVTGYQSPAAAGVVNGTLYKYRAESSDLSQWELGEGAYTTGTGVLARTTVLFNNLGTTAKINFTAVPQVAIVALKEDLPNLNTTNAFTDTTGINPSVATTGSMTLAGGLGVSGGIVTGGGFNATGGTFTAFYRPDLANQFKIAVSSNDLFLRWNFNDGSSIMTLNNTGDLATTGQIGSSAATRGVGYLTGAGGTVTQITSRNTGVTLNAVSGDIVLFSAVNAAINADTANALTVTNSAVAITDTINIVQKSGTDKYLIFVTNMNSGSFAITFFTTGGTTNEAPVFHFNVIKGVNA